MAFDEITSGYLIANPSAYFLVDIFLDLSVYSEILPSFGVHAIPYFSAPFQNPL